MGGAGEFEGGSGTFRGGVGIAEAEAGAGNHGVGGGGVGKERVGRAGSRVGRGGDKLAADKFRGDAGKQGFTAADGMHAVDGVDIEFEPFFEPWVVGAVGVPWSASEVARGVEGAVVGKVEAFAQGMVVVAVVEADAVDEGLDHGGVVVAEAGFAVA